jgi:preprotein translocase subunit YajC
VKGFLGLLPFLVVLGITWLFLYRPTRQRQQQLVKLQRELSVGDSVMTTSGIYGSVRSLSDDRIELEISPGVVIVVARRAIGSKETPGLATDKGEN